MADMVFWVPPVVAKQPFCRVSWAGDVSTPAKFGCWAANQEQKVPAFRAKGSVTCRKRSPFMANSQLKRL